MTEPCGVCVIQMPYPGSPAATHDGIPMKYSTLRSKTWLPSRCPRIAAFVSGVIQFRRPISSSGPHGLFDTFRPSCSRIASGTSSGSDMAWSLLREWPDRAYPPERFAQRRRDGRPIVTAGCHGLTRRARRSRGARDAPRGRTRSALSPTSSGGLTLMALHPARSAARTRSMRGRGGGHGQRNSRPERPSRPIDAVTTEIASRGSIAFPLPDLQGGGGRQRPPATRSSQSSQPRRRRGADAPTSAPTTSRAAPPDERVLPAERRSALLLAPRGPPLTGASSARAPALAASAARDLGRLGRHASGASPSQLVRDSSPSVRARTSAGLASARYQTASAPAAPRRPR